MRRKAIALVLLSWIGVAVAAPVVAQAAPAASADCSRAETHWKSAEQIGTLAVYQDHLARFPSCDFAVLAAARIDALRTAAGASPTPAASPPAAPPPPAPPAAQAAAAEPTGPDRLNKCFKDAVAQQRPTKGSAIGKAQRVITTCRTVIREEFCGSPDCQRGEGIFLRVILGELTGLDPS